MSLFGGLIAGAMQGGGQALQIQARDEAEAERKAKFEEQRQKAEMDRQLALEGLRQKNQTADTQMRYELGLKSNEHAAGLALTRDAQNNEQARARQGEEIDYRKGESAADRELRLRDLQSRDADRKSQRELELLRIQAQKDIASDRLGALGRMPAADAAAVKSLDAERKSIDDALRKAQADPMFDPNSAGIKALTEERAQVQKRQQSILERHGLAAPTQAPAAASQPTLSGDQQKAMVTRLESLKSDPVKLESALKEAERRGLPLDLLKPFKAEKPKEWEGQKPEPPKTGLVDKAVRDPYAGLSPEERPTPAQEAEVKARIEEAKKSQAAAIEAERKRALGNPNVPNKERDNFIQSLTPDVIAKMSPEEAMTVRNQYGALLPRAIRNLLDARTR